MKKAANGIPLAAFKQGNGGGTVLKKSAASSLSNVRAINRA